MNVQELALAGLNDRRLFTFLDLAGTFAFAISGAAAARNRGLDWFGVIVIAFAVACGGGVVRDLCIGAVPPTGLSDGRYLAVALGAAVMTMAANTWVVLLARPVIFVRFLGPRTICRDRRAKGHGLGPQRRGGGATGRGHRRGGRRAA